MKTETAVCNALKWYHDPLGQAPAVCTLDPTRQVSLSGTELGYRVGGDTSKPVTALGVRAVGGHWLLRFSWGRSLYFLKMVRRVALIPHVFQNLLLSSRHSSSMLLLLERW